MPERPPPDRLEGFMAQPRRAVWKLALPTIAGMVFHLAYSFADTAFVGHLGPDALAAQTFVFPLFFVITALTGGLAAGVTAAVARALGRRDQEESSHTASAGFGLGLLAGALMAVGGHFLGPRLLQLLGAEGGVVDLAWAYFRIIALGAPAFFVSASLRAVLAGEGDARTPMLVMVAATLTNLGLDPLLIYTAGLGIAGAALATLAAQGVALVSFSFLVLPGRRTRARIRPLPLAQLAAPALVILRVGLPASASQLAAALASALGTRLLAHFGQLAVAGYGAASRVNMLVSLPLFGLAASSLSLIGMFSGARRCDLVRLIVCYTWRWAVILAFLLGGGAYLASGAVLRLFTDAPEALAVGRSYLGYMVFGYPLMGLGITSGRMLQGLGLGLPTLLLTLLRELVVGIPLAYLGVYAFDAPISWVWLSYIAGGATSALLSMAWVRRVAWREQPPLGGTPPVPPGELDQGIGDLVQG